MDLIERLTDEADGYGDGPVVMHDIEGLRSLLREAAAALAAAREDAERWRHARRILPVEDIEYSQDMFDARGAKVDEHESRKADAAIDRARGK